MPNHKPEQPDAPQKSLSEIIRQASQEYAAITRQPTEPGKTRQQPGETRTTKKPQQQEQEPPAKQKRTPLRILKKAAIAIALAITGTIFTVILTTALIVNLIDLREFNARHNKLLELAETLETEQESKPALSTEPYAEPQQPQDAPEPRHISAFDAGMRDINPDYICWIKIEGTEIDYPVVRGEDNEQYLSLSFFNERNGLGALFMDYRCAGEYVPHIIIYGHNARSGVLFGGLRRFLGERYLTEHPIITLKVNDRIVEYEIYSARETDITDPAYHLDFSAPGSFTEFAERNGAPPDAAQILTLSTCVSGNNKDERIIIQAALR